MLRCVAIVTAFTAPVPVRRPPVLGAHIDHVQRAWESKLLDPNDNELIKKQARMTWAHVRAARLAIKDGFVDKARKSYNYYLDRFSKFSGEFVTDVCLRLAVLEQCQGNTPEARDAFVKGARVVGTAMAKQHDTARLRERGATLFCSWGLHESKKTHPQYRKVRGLLEHAVRLDASKSPVLRWSRFRVRMNAAAVDYSELPLWKVKQNERYEALVRDALRADADAVARLEERCGKRTTARSKQLLGSWNLVHAAAFSCCNCAATKVSLPLGTTLKLDGSVCQLGPNATAAYSAVGDNILQFNTTLAPFEGRATVTYVDDRLMIMRRLRCGHPLIILQRA